MFKNGCIILLSILFYTFHSHSSHAGDLQIFPAPQDAKADPEYSLKVNGKEVFIYNSSYNPFAIFNFNGTADLEITTSSDLKWVNIRPLSDSIKWRTKGNSLFFSLDHPCNLSIEFNNEETRALFLFTSAISPDKELSPDVILFKGGKTYHAGIIELKTNDILFIEGGAVVKGTIHASHADNIRIMGNGILDGTVVIPPDPHRMIDLHDCHNVLINDITIHNSPTWTIAAWNCTGLEINNVKEINWKFGSDGIDLVGSSHVKVQGCFLKNNDDCIAIKSFNPDRSDSADDKSKNVSDIDISECTVWNMQWGNAFEIGFELRCDSISDISFRNSDIIHVERGAAISIHNGDFARVCNIRYENINIEQANHKLIDLAIFLSQYSLDRPVSAEARNSRYMNGAWDGVLKVYDGEEKTYEKGRGYINNILFSNIRVVEGSFPFSILSGYNTKHNIQDVTFRNLRILNKKINDAENGHFSLNYSENINFR